MLFSQHGELRTMWETDGTCNDQRGDVWRLGPNGKKDYPLEGTSRIVSTSLSVSILFSNTYCNTDKQPH
jgi:hypothetical protein